jgi:hypothetical protein
MVNGECDGARKDLVFSAETTPTNLTMLFILDCNTISARGYTYYV